MDALTARLASVAIEAAAAAGWIAWRRWPVRGGAAGAAGAAALGTLASHPLAWDGIIALAPRIGYGVAVGLVEALVVLGEAAVYAGVLVLSPVRALVLSLVANGASLAIGLAIQLS